MNGEFAWLHWWACAWLQAAPDWTPAPLAGIGRQRLAGLARSQHVALSRAYGIQPCAAPKPRLALLELIRADAQRRELTFTLVAALCAPQADFALTAEQRVWCRSIAKALRPGQWLVGGQDPLALLRTWAGPAAWQRLRLSLPRTRVISLEQNPAPRAPATKLDALWGGALWRSAQCIQSAPREGVFDNVRSAFA